MSPPTRTLYIGAPARRTTLLVICSISAFLTPFMGSSINLGLPAISRELSMDAVLLSWVATAYNLAAAMFLVPLGRVADLWGRERAYRTGMAVYAAFSILCASAWSGSVLIAARFLQGIGGAMIFGTSTAILTSSFPPQERGKVLGINVSAVYLGSSLGPLIGGLMVHEWGWRSIFALNAVLAAAVIVLAMMHMRPTPTGQEGGRFDWPGSMVYGASLALLMLGFTGLPAAARAILLAAGAAGIGMFLWMAVRSSSPVLDVKIFRGNTVFIFSNLAALINYSATFAIGFLLSLYLQYTRGFTPQQAGLTLVVQPVIMAAFSSLGGSLSDRVEPRILASAGMALITVGLAVFAFLSAATPLALIVACLAFIGLGFALFSSPNTNAAMSAVDRRYYGVASATIATMRQCGMMLSMGGIAVIFSVVMGRVQITPEYYGRFLASARIGFAVFAALCFAGIFASLARGRVRPKATGD